MSRFLQSRSCNDDFFAETMSLNSSLNSNTLDDDRISQLAKQINDINVTKRKRPETKFYGFARALVNEGEMSAAEAEMDPDYNDYCNYTDNYAYTSYDYDEDAMIQEDEYCHYQDPLENEEKGQQDPDNCVDDSDGPIVLDESVLNEINQDFDELQQLRAENARLRENLTQQRIAFPVGSSIRFVTVDGIQYLQVFQESTRMSIDELNCDANEEF